MTDLVMAASANALALARAEQGEEVTPDHLLLGALRAVATLGVTVFGSLVLNLSELAGDGEAEYARVPPNLRPRYAPDTAAIFDRAARIAREDGEPKVRLVHLLAAFGPDHGTLMKRLMTQYGFDETTWRAALAGWDQGQRRQGIVPGDQRKVLSVDAAAATLGVHAQTIRGYIRTGKLTAYRIAGERAIRILASDLYALLEPCAPDAGALPEAT